MAAATEQGGAEGVKMKTDVRNNPATGPDHYLKRANAPWWIKPPKLKQIYKSDGKKEKRTTQTSLPVNKYSTRDQNVIVARIYQ